MVAALGQGHALVCVSYPSFVTAWNVENSPVLVDRPQLAPHPTPRELLHDGAVGQWGALVFVVDNVAQDGLELGGAGVVTAHPAVGEQLAETVRGATPEEVFAFDQTTDLAVVHPDLGGDGASRQVEQKVGPAMEEGLLRFDRTNGDLLEECLPVFELL